MLDAVDALGRDHAAALSAVAGIGLSGQMHGAVLLDAAGSVLRPAILWNDVRSATECTELEEAVPDLRQVTGNIAMPGFTAPKLMWVRKHEPGVFARLRTVLLPKAYIRSRMTGEMIEEMSDASGTLWLDVGARDWSDVMLAATGLSREAMPRLVEGNAAAGALRPELAARWRMAGRPILAGGAGDNAAGAIGLSAIRPGDAFVSLGTSGVLFATTDRFRPYPQAAVHAFCHALPATWHQMGVTLSAAASLAWWAGVTGRSEAELLAEVGQPGVTEPRGFLAVSWRRADTAQRWHAPRRLRRVVARHRSAPADAGGAGGRGLLVAGLPGCAAGLWNADRDGGRDRRRLPVAHMGCDHRLCPGDPARPSGCRRDRRCIRGGQACPDGGDWRGSGCSLCVAGPRRDYSPRSDTDLGLRGTAGGLSWLKPGRRRRGAGGLR